MTDPLLERYLAQVAAGTPVTLTTAEIAELRERYPFFSQPAASALESGERLSDEEREMLRRELSLNSADLRDVEALLQRIAGAPAFYPPEGADRRMTTESTIDAFLERYGNPADNDRELSTLEKLIFNPVAPDYMATLESAPEEATTDAAATAAAVAAEEVTEAEATPTEPSTQDRLIDAFLSSHPESTGQEVPAEQLGVSTSASEQPAVSTRATEPPMASTPASEQPDRHALLSESLAKIFIRRGRYEKAFEIIHSLSLNYPEKSVYFADQLRFLQKAIQISKRREAAQPTDNQR